MGMISWQQILSGEWFFRAVDVANKSAPVQLLPPKISHHPLQGREEVRKMALINPQRFLLAALGGVGQILLQWHFHTIDFSDGTPSDIDVLKSRSFFTIVESIDGEDLGLFDFVQG